MPHSILRPLRLDGAADPAGVPTSKVQQAKQGLGSENEGEAFRSGVSVSPRSQSAPADEPLALAWPPPTSGIGQGCDGTTPRPELSPWPRSERC